MIVRDLQEDAKQVLGSCSTEMLLRRLSDAVELLANSGDGNWDGMIGELTVAVDSGTSTITLPRDVLTPLQINVDDTPTFPRTRWFEYHINGTGGKWIDYNRAWDDKGTYPIIRTIPSPSPLRVESETAADDGKSIRLGIVDDEGREQTITVTLNFAQSPTVAINVDDILWVSKDETVGWVKVFYTSPEDTLLGWYYPDEKTPQYRRIRVTADSSVKLIYRRRNRRITSLDDNIPLNNRLAVIQALRAVNARFMNRLAEAMEYELDAWKLLNNEQNVRNINNSPIGPQVLDVSSWNNERLRY